MSRYDEFNVEDFRAKVRAILLIVSFAIGGFLYWMFGHPTEHDKLLALAILLGLLTLNLVETTRQYIERSNALSRARHDKLDEVSSQIISHLERLDIELEEIKKDLEGLGKDVGNELRDIDKAVFDISLRVKN